MGLAVVVLALLLLLLLLLRDGGPGPAPARARARTAAAGAVDRCAVLKGERARACYDREVTLALKSVRTPVIPGDRGTALLCELHTRIGRVDADTPAWLGPIGLPGT